ncbi:MAG: hypothetical protein KGL39_06730 [Patescibacteria group bacterium]|nr:hypothetical protein [Patescibacteria group bacterium]
MPIWILLLAVLLVLTACAACLWWGNRRWEIQHAMYKPLRDALKEP